MSLEFKEQLSSLQKPDREEMTEAQYELFDGKVEEMEKNWGFSNNLFRILPLNAEEYVGFLNFKGSLFNEKCHLTDAEKEVIGVVVSAANSCAFCLTTHGDILRGLTKDPRLVDLLSYNYRAADLTVRQRALCDYAYFVTVHPREIDTDQVDKLREAGMNDHEIVEAAYVAGFFNYTNRWVSTVRPEPNPGHNNHNR